MMTIPSIIEPGSTAGGAGFDMASERRAISRTQLGLKWGMEKIRLLEHAPSHPAELEFDRIRLSGQSSAKPVAIPQDGRDTNRTARPYKPSAREELPADLVCHSPADQASVKRARASLSLTGLGVITRALHDQVHVSAQEQKQAIFALASRVHTLPINERSSELRLLISRYSQITSEDSDSDTESQFALGAKRGREVSSVDMNAFDERALIQAIPALSPNQRAQAWLLAFAALKPQRDSFTPTIDQTLVRPLLAVALHIPYEKIAEKYQILLLQAQRSRYRLVGVVNDMIAHIDSLPRESERIKSLNDAINRLANGVSSEINDQAQFLEAALHSVSEDDADVLRGAIGTAVTRGESQLLQTRLNLERRVFAKIRSSGRRSLLAQSL